MYADIASESAAIGAVMSDHADDPPPPAPHAEPVCVITPELLICRHPADAGSVAGKVIVIEDDGAPLRKVVVFVLLELLRTICPVTEEPIPTFSEVPK